MTNDNLLINRLIVAALVTMSHELQDVNVTQVFSSHPSSLQFKTMVNDLPQMFLLSYS